MGDSLANKVPEEKCHDARRRIVVVKVGARDGPKLFGGPHLASNAFKNKNPRTSRGFGFAEGE
jgi:hypothetical protein